MAGGHIADAVAAGFAGSDIDGGQAAHESGCVVNVNEVELNILARGDVRDAVGIFFGQFGEDFELRRVKPAERNFDALHAGRVPERVRTFGEGSRG